MSKHTKGPWEARADWIVGFNGTLHIATIPRAFDGDYSEANALLIAAAPDLLEALKDVLDAFDCLGECDCEGSSLCAVCNAQNAIAKAEGVK